MKRIFSLAIVLTVLAVFAFVTTDAAYAQGKGRMGEKKAQQQYGPFDQDGDGIPNGQDPDFVKPRDGSGKQFGKLHRSGRRMGYGSGDGSGACGIGPLGGSGFGSGTGICDGTGPKGKRGPRN